MVATATISLGSPFAPPLHLLSRSGRHKLRLLVGEGNFSFTKAFIQKYT